MEGAEVVSIGLEKAGLGGISHQGRKNLVVNPDTSYGIADRKDDLAAFEQVAGHPIGRAQVDFVVAAVGEVKDAGMLEEAAHDGANANAVGEARNAGPQGTHAANDEIDFNPGLRCRVERFDYAWLEQRVHLGDDVRGAAGAGVFRLPPDQPQEALSHGE